MSENKWTEGPWIAEFSNCHAGQVAVCHGDGEGYWEVWTQNWGGGIDPEANANLIAAAPELYNALDVLSKVCEAKGIPCDAAKAALAKARGGE